MLHTENNSDSLPPKTCTIDRMITLATDISKVLAGTKKATRRNGRYADVGEIMELEGKSFIITRVFSQQLGEMTDEDASQEGYQSLEEYKQSILAMHPGMKWVPQMKVWVHEFSPVQE